MVPTTEAGGAHPTAVAEVIQVAESPVALWVVVLTSGQAVVGKRSECFRKGVGGGLHAKIPPGGRDEFIQKWTASYRKIVEQPLHYVDGPPPAGKNPATLSQCLARGFAVGSIQKAKKEMRKAE